MSDAKCENVENTVRHRWNIRMEDHGGQLKVNWYSSTEAEPNWLRIVVYLDGREVDQRNAGASRGEHVFGRPYGAKYRAALEAKDYSDKWATVVTTGVSTHVRETLDAVAHFPFRIALGQNTDKNAQLTWGTPGNPEDPPFRMRDSEAIFDEDGKIRRDPIGGPAHSFDTGARWGTKLQAAYSAQDYSGKRFNIVETPRTKTASEEAPVAEALA